MANFENLMKAIQEGNFPETENQVKALLSQGKSGEDIIQQGVVKALDIVGKKFSEGECFIPEMLVAAKASQEALDILRPSLKKTGFKDKGKIVIGTVRGDLHDLGKNIVAMTLRAGGYQVIDLGVDVPPQKFVDTLKTEKANILALSCLITTTMNSMEGALKAIRESDFGEKVRVMIGGPPTTDEFAKRIGADFRGKDAYDALMQVNHWTGT